MSELAVDFCFVPTGPVSEVVTLASLGEKLGYRCMWIPDQGFCRDPFVIATAVAAATRTLDIGIGITMPLTRHAAHLARVAATLDELSDYRLRLGLGSGNLAHVVRPMGLSVKNSVERVSTGLTQVRSLLRGEPVQFADEPIGPVKLEFVPRRVMPLYVGARGPKMLEMAGAVSDGVLVESLFNAGGMPDAVARVRSGALQTGRDASACDVVSWQLVVVTDEPERELDQYRPWVARTLQAGPREAMLRVGVNEATYERVTAALAAGCPDDAAREVTDDAVRCLMMIGPAGELIERIGALEALGCTSISVLSTKPLAQTAENLVRFARTVLPAVSRA